MRREGPPFRHVGGGRRVCRQSGGDLVIVTRHAQTASRFAARWDNRQRCPLSGSPADDIELYGRRYAVRQSRAHVFISTGQVQKPGQFVVWSGAMTVMQALAVRRRCYRQRHANGVSSAHRRDTGGRKGEGGERCSDEDCPGQGTSSTSKRVYFKPGATARFDSSENQR